MKKIKVYWMGKPLRDVYPHATWFQVKKWQAQEFLKACVRFLFKLSCWGAVAAAIFAFGYYYAHTETVYATIVEERIKTVDSLNVKIEKLKDELINEIAKKESGNSPTANGLIVYDDNSRGTLSQKDKVSIGCMQFKVGTVQHYTKTLEKKDLSNYEATLLALDCDQAKALAKKIIFEANGLSNWSVATDKMATKVSLIKELSK